VRRHLSPIFLFCLLAVAIQSDPGVHVDVELGCQTKKAIIN
jgi:hypothetical protein